MHDTPKSEDLPLGARPAADWRQAVIESLDQVIAEMRETLNGLRNSNNGGEDTRQGLPSRDRVVADIADLEKQIELVEQTKAVALDRFR